MKKEFKTIKKVSEAWNKKLWGFYDLQEPASLKVQAEDSEYENWFLDTIYSRINPKKYKLGTSIRRPKLKLRKFSIPPGHIPVWVFGKRNIKI